MHIGRTKRSENASSDGKCRLIACQSWIFVMGLLPSASWLRLWYARSVSVLDVDASLRKHCGVVRRLRTAIRWDLVCPLSVTERFLLQPLVYGTVFHRTSLLPPLCLYSVVVLNHISSHFLISLSDSSLICAVSAQWLVILDTVITCTFLRAECNT